MSVSSEPKFTMLTGKSEKSSAPLGEQRYKNNGKFFQLKLKSMVKVSSKSKSKTNSMMNSSIKQMP